MTLTLSTSHHIISDMSNSDDVFLSRAKDRVTAIRREIALLEAQEAGVRRRRNELEKDFADWARSVELYTDAMGLESAGAGSPAPGQLTVPVEAPSESVSDLMFRYMTDMSTPTAKVGDIAAALIEVGKFSSDPDKAGTAYSAVYTALLRSPERFEKVGRGEFRLVPAESS